MTAPLIPQANPRANYLAHRAEIDAAIARVLQGGIEAADRHAQAARRDVELLACDQRTGLVLVADQLLVGDLALAQSEARDCGVGRQIGFIRDREAGGVPLENEQTEPLGALLARREQKQVGARVADRCRAVGSLGEVECGAADRHDSGCRGDRCDREKRARALALSQERGDDRLVPVALGQRPRVDPQGDLVGQEGQRCQLFPGDLRERAACDQLVEETVRHYGRLDILVNNAAFQQHQTTITDIDDEQWERFQHPAVIELKAGEATFHHPLMVHGSFANRTERPRRATVINAFLDGVASDTDEVLLDGVPPIPRGRKMEGQFFPLLLEPGAEISS